MTDWNFLRKKKKKKKTQLFKKKKKIPRALFQLLPTSSLGSIRLDAYLLHRKFSISVSQ